MLSVSRLLDVGSGNNLTAIAYINIMGEMGKRTKMNHLVHFKYGKNIEHIILVSLAKI